MNLEMETVLEDFDRVASDEAELADSEPTTPIDRLHSILSRPFAELKEATLEEIQAHERSLVDIMRTNDFSANLFLDIAAKFPAPLQKKLKDPMVVREQTLSHIVDLRRLCHERFAKEQAAFEKSERERRRSLIEQQQRRILDQQTLKLESEQREAWNVLQRADEYGEQRFQEWDDQRQAVDGRRQPRKIHPDHQALVDRIEARARQQKEAGRNFHEVMARMERAFGDWLSEYEIFGADVVTKAGPVNKFDDITKHVDDGVAHSIPGVKKKLGIDFSVNGNDIDLARKLKHGIEHPIERVSYNTVNFSTVDEFIPIVLTLDDDRAERLMRQSNFRAVIDPKNPIHQQMAESFSAVSARFHDREILQYTIVEEALEQVRFQLEEMERRQLSPEFLTDHRALVAYLEDILEKRKDLRDVANAEVEKETVRAVYRTRDRDFIRSAATSVAA